MRGLVRDYASLRDLTNGITPQQRGSELNHLLARVLCLYSLSARASQNSELGEIDVSFAMDGNRFILEAKWQKDRIDLAPISFLATRARQRLSGTLGIFVSMSGFTADALNQVGRTGEQNSILLFDANHVEAMVSGLASPQELISAALDEAGSTGRFYVTIPDLIGPHDAPSVPHVQFGRPFGYFEELVESSLSSTTAEFLLHSETEIRGLAIESEGSLLVVFAKGIARIEPRRSQAAWVLKISSIGRNIQVDQEGTIWALRHGAVIRLSDGGFGVVAGGFSQGSVLFSGRDGHPWVLETSSMLIGQRNSPSYLVSLGTQLGDEEWHRLPGYAAETARNAVWLWADQFLVASFDQLAVVDLNDRSDEYWLETPVANPQGLAVLDDEVIVAGDKRRVAIWKVDLNNDRTGELIDLNLSGSVSELACRGGDLYLSSSAPVGSQTVPVVVRVFESIEWDEDS
jgi:hypothetical protein